jgi:hypothetical protein
MIAAQEEGAPYQRVTSPARRAARRRGAAGAEAGPPRILLRRARGLQGRMTPAQYEKLLADQRSGRAYTHCRHKARPRPQPFARGPPAASRLTQFGLSNESPRAHAAAAG